MEPERGKQWACVCASFLSLAPLYLPSLECAEGQHVCRDAVSCFGCPEKVKCHHGAALRHGVRTHSCLLYGSGGSRSFAEICLHWLTSHCSMLRTDTCTELLKYRSSAGQLGILFVDDPRWRAVWHLSALMASVGVVSPGTSCLRKEFKRCLAAQHAGPLLQLCCSNCPAEIRLCIYIQCIAALVLVRESAAKLGGGGKCSRPLFGLVALEYQGCYRCLYVNQQVRQRPAAESIASSR